MNTNELHSLHSMRVLYDLQVKTQKKAVFPGTHYGTSEAGLNAVLTEL